jgi:hypothetical protein
MGDFTRQCSWCKRVYRDGAWTTVTEALDPWHTTHGMCPDCADRYYPGVTAEHPTPAPTPTPAPSKC